MRDNYSSRPNRGQLLKYTTRGSRGFSHDPGLDALFISCRGRWRFRVCRRASPRCLPSPAIPFACGRWVSVRSSGDAVQGICTFAIGLGFNHATSPRNVTRHQHDDRFCLVVIGDVRMPFMFARRAGQREGGPRPRAVGSLSLETHVRVAHGSRGAPRMCGRRSAQLLSAKVPSEPHPTSAPRPVLPIGSLDQRD